MSRRGNQGGTRDCNIKRTEQQRARGNGMISNQGVNALARMNKTKIEQHKHN